MNSQPYIKQTHTKHTQHNLAKLADICDSHESSRFAVTSVHVKIHDDKTFLAESTDTRRLIRVAGPCVDGSEEFPDCAGMTSAPNGKSEALIPGKVWSKTFQAANKMTKRIKDGSPLKSVAVKLGENVATFAYTDLESFPVESTKLCDGRFPPAENIIPKSFTGRDRIRINPILWGETLKTFGALMGESEVDENGVILETNGHKVAKLEARTANGQTITAILMPMFHKDDEREFGTRQSEHIERLQEELDATKKKLFGQNFPDESEGLHRQLSEAKELIAIVCRERDEAYEELNRLRSDERMNDLTRERDEAREEAARLREDCAALQRHLEDESTRRSALIQETIHHRANVAQLRESMSKAIAELHALASIAD